MAHGQLRVGDFADFTKTITETDLVLFSGISGDFNPYHIDDIAASASRFGGRVVQGMLSSSLLCAVLGMRLPGPGTIHLEQTLRFVVPVRPGDTITARVEIQELLLNNRVRLITQCRNQHGALVVDGHAIVLAPLGGEKA